MERWDIIANNLDGRYLKDLHFEIDEFVGEISYALNMVDVDDELSFSDLKQVAHFLKSIKKYDLENDGYKPILSMFWSLLSGWDWSKGYSDKDVVLSTVEEFI